MESVELRDYPRSKMGPPRRSGAEVARARLLRELDIDTPLVLVIAPAGSGKTAMLASWMNTRRASQEESTSCPTGTRGAVIWYNVDPADREPILLVDGLAAAAELAIPGAGLAARTAIARGSAAFAALALLLARLEQQVSATLILDNCHHIDGARCAEAVVEHLVRNRPPTLRLVLSSRSIPLLPALSAAAAGELRALGRAELSFTTSEAAALLENHGLDAARIADLMRASQGWAMGLLLLSHARSGNMAFFPQPMEVLSEFLMNQIVDDLPSALRIFLLESALLRSFSASEADGILQRQDSRLQIDAILRQGLFAESYPSKDGPTLRYHDVFAGALAGTLQRIAPARFTEIHTRAVGFYTSDPLRALTHCAALGDPTQLATLLERALPVLRSRGHWETLIRFAELIPQAQRSLLVLRMLSFAFYMRGDDGQAIAMAEDVYARAIAIGDTVSALSALVLRANPLVRQNRCVEALALCEPALEQARASGSQQAEGWLAEICAQALLRDGRVEEGHKQARRALALHRAAAAAGIPGAALALARANQDLALVLLDIGDDRTAQACLDEATACATDHGDRTMHALCQATRARLLVLRGEDSAAYDLARQVGMLARDDGNILALRNALFAQAQACGRLNRIDEGLAALEERTTLLGGSPTTLLSLGLVLRARLCLQAGNVAGSQAALDRAIGMDLSDRARGPVLLERGALALAQGRNHQAERLFAEAVSAAATYSLLPDQARALILQAEALVRLHKHRRAVACLAQAGNLAMRTGWLASMPIDASAALGAVRALSSHWRLTGKGREIAAYLLRTTPHRLHPAPQISPAPPQEVPGGIGVATPHDEPFRFSPFADGMIYRHGDGAALALLGRSKSRELLAYALWKACPLSRDDILEALWDGEVNAKTLNALRSASHQIRRFLGPRSWILAHGTYTVGYQYEDDYRALLALAVTLQEQEGSPAEVAALAERGLVLYTGDYLPWCCSAWTEQPRSMARTAVLTVIGALVETRCRLGQRIAALAAAERGLAIVPSHERLRRCQISLLLELGRPAEALDSYRKYLQILEDECLDPPSEELQALIASVRQR